MFNTNAKVDKKSFYYRITFLSYASSVKLFQFCLHLYEITFKLLIIQIISVFIKFFLYCTVMLNLTNIALFNFLIPFLWRYLRPQSREASTFREHCNPVFKIASLYSRNRNLKRAIMQSLGFSIDLKFHEKGVLKNPSDKIRKLINNHNLGLIQQHQNW